MAKKESLVLYQAILDANKNPNDTQEFGGKDGLIAAFKNSGGKLDKKLTDSKITLLHAAAIGGNTKLVTLLLENGAKPNIQDKFGNTPLHYAAQNGHVAAMETLLEHKDLDANQQNKDGKKALSLATKDTLDELFHHAFDKNKTNIVDTIKQQRPDITAVRSMISTQALDAVPLPSLVTAQLHSLKKGDATFNRSIEGAKKNIGNDAIINELATTHPVIVATLAQSGPERDYSKFLTDPKRNAVKKGYNTLEANRLATNEYIKNNVKSVADLDDPKVQEGLQKINTNTLQFIKSELEQAESGLGIAAMIPPTLIKEHLDRVNTILDLATPRTSKIVKNLDPDLRTESSTDQGISTNPFDKYDFNKNPLNPFAQESKPHLLDKETQQKALKAVAGLSGFVSSSHSGGGRYAPGEKKGGMGGPS